MDQSLPRKAVRLIPSMEGSISSICGIFFFLLVGQCPKAMANDRARLALTSPGKAQLPQKPIGCVACADVQGYWFTKEYTHVTTVNDLEIISPDTRWTGLGKCRTRPLDRQSHFLSLRALERDDRWCLESQHNYRF